MREFSTDQRFTPGLCCKSSSVHQQIACTLPLYPQYVCVNGLPSDIPLLFIIYIDDITDLQLFDGSMSMYADNISLYRPIYTPADYDLLYNRIVMTSAPGPPTTCQIQLHQMQAWLSLYT